MRPSQIILFPKFNIAVSIIENLSGINCSIESVMPKTQYIKFDELLSSKECLLSVFK